MNEVPLPAHAIRLTYRAMSARGKASTPGIRERGAGTRAACGKRTFLTPRFPQAATGGRCPQSYCTATVAGSLSFTRTNPPVGTHPS